MVALGTAVVEVERRYGLDRNVGNDEIEQGIAGIGIEAAIGTVE